MPVLEKGRVCIKKTGRKAGEKLVVVGKKGGKILVKDDKGKEKKCSAGDLFPTREKKIK